MTTTEIKNYRLELKKLIKKGKIPTLPAVAQKLLQLCKDDTASFAEFGSVIESDQGMATRILHVANSAYYGLRQKATTVERAISALGLKYVRSIALGYNLLNTLNRFETKGFNQHDFWSQSLLRAVLGRQIGARYCPKFKEEAFLIGLIQDAGVLLLLQAIGDHYAAIWKDTSLSHYAVYNMEKQLFQLNHIEATGFLARSWGLPAMLVGPISMHHTKRTLSPAKTSELKLYQIAYFSGMLSFNNPTEVCKEDLELSVYCKKVFGLDNAGLKDLFTDVNHEYSSIVGLFSDIFQNPMNVADILIETNKQLSGMTEETNKVILDFDNDAAIDDSRFNF